MTRQIIIVGFMGAGKTSVVRALALRLKCAVVDLDEFITDNEGRSPAEIIDQDGESHFREVEAKTLRDLLVEGSAGVIGLGGGAWTMAENRRLIIDHGALTVWLDAPFDLCWKRIESGNEARPLAPSRELAANLYSSRRASYEHSDVRVEIAADATVDDVASQVIRMVSSPPS